jgi:hypothetical protein
MLNGQQQRYPLNVSMVSQCGVTAAPPASASCQSLDEDVAKVSQHVSFLPYFCWQFYSESCVVWTIPRFDLSIQPVVFGICRIAAILRHAVGQ